MAAHLSAEQVGLALRLRARGMTLTEVGRQVCCSLGEVHQLEAGGRRREPRPLGWEPGPGRLTVADREEISLGLHGGQSFTVIAGRLGRACSTVSREVAANGGRRGYRAWRAHARAREQARRPRARKLDDRVLAGAVSFLLRAWWSPQQVAARLRADHPGDPMRQVSHETIYQSLYVQGRGELRRELARCLRSGRAARRPHREKGTDRRGKIPGMVMISERPAEAADRAVPGHWEGDLIIGKGGKSAVGTLVERTTRFVMLLHLPAGHGAKAVSDAMAAAVTTLPAALARSVTWDQGAEMHGHAEFTLATGIPVYFAEPHSPWQRGSNENTNGLLRQYMPKGTDLSLHDAAALAAVADSLNTRPRMTLGYMTPSEKLAELIALTA
jgi:transposase, IS30 family